MQDIPSSSSPRGQSGYPSHSAWSSMQRQRLAASGDGQATLSDPSSDGGHSIKVNGHTYTYEKKIHRQ